MSEVCFSSEVYKIEPKDLIILEDSQAANIKTKDEVVVILNDGEKNSKDRLLCGREWIEKAIAENKDFIPVRFAFVSKMHKWDFLSPFIRPLRNRYKIYSSNIYHINPLEVRRIKIERNIRNKENAYIFTNPKFRMDDKNLRNEQYDKLYESMQKGFDDRFPLDVMLLRMMGIKDTINQGHHRMGIAVQCNLPRVAIKFCAAGKAPNILHPILRIIAKININLKLWNKQ